MYLLLMRFIEKMIRQANQYYHRPGFLKFCECIKNWSLQGLVGKPYGGIFICLECGQTSPAKIVNKF